MFSVPTVSFRNFSFSFSTKFFYFFLVFFIPIKEFLGLCDVGPLTKLACFVKIHLRRLAETKFSRWTDDCDVFGQKTLRSLSTEHSTWKHRASTDQNRRPHSFCSAPVP